MTGLGTIRILEAIRKSGVNARFYQASSSEMYGGASPPQNERTRFEPRSLSPDEVQAYVGIYYSEELDVEYLLEVKDGSLVFGIDRPGSHSLEAQLGEIFANADYGIFEFARGAEGEVIGFSLDAGRVRDLEFIRRPSA